MIKDLEGYQRQLRRYRAGLVLAITLTALPTALVKWAALSFDTTLAAILLLAVVQILVHFYCFLQVGAERSEQDKWPMLLFSVLIVALMVGGTLLVYYDQMHRM
ncbi:cytochrome C oxidase subunit IV family protein (plasmid) [Pseudomonas sp. HR96]|uniref:cytochrome o ubiquinol oxidase subunit IV n=1 Tax=Pseudomonas sp. HR96 TaxID=1027966 RepID=UPI002A74C3BF|nr:cytochrome C oxidase subunit IV family protein [Pseudomonas sp. HR96]WPP02376.1 cytochrome C oxidase subunit IV family protein [Pseudomonas sp. HR96]